MFNRKQEIDAYIKDFRKLALEAKSGQNLKAISVFTNVAGKALQFMKFEAQVARTDKARKPKVKG